MALKASVGLPGNAHPPSLTGALGERSAPEAEEAA